MYASGQRVNSKRSLKLLVI